MMRSFVAAMVAVVSAGCWCPLYVAPDNSARLLTHQEKLSAVLDKSLKNAGVFARLANSRVYIEVKTLADTESPGAVAEFVRAYVKKLLLREAPKGVVLDERGEENVVLVVLVRALGVEARPLLLGPFSLIFHIVRYRAVCELSLYAYDNAGNFRIKPTKMPKAEIKWSKFLVFGGGPF